MASKLVAALASFLLLSSVGVVIAIAIIQIYKITYLSPGLKYGIVLDCGSSRTTVYLYDWPAEKENDTGVIKEKLQCNVKGPGISDLGLNSSQDKETWIHFKKCMAQVKQGIPASAHNSTPIFLGATAGMRLLQHQNETASNQILLDMKNYLQSLPFQFQNASIISGEEEGLYGWITVNYLMDNFLQKDLWNSWVRPHGAQTAGSLDLGGASTQIAFATTDDARGEGLTKVVLYGYEYTVYTHSFLCFGKNEAEKTVLAKLVQGSTDPNNVQNPCYPLGFNITMREDFIFGSECTRKLRVADYNPERNITIFGGGDAAECRKAVRHIFDLSSCHGSQNCSFNGVYQPPVSGKFKAYAGFYYTAWALRLIGSSTLDQFNSTLWSFCSMDWPNLKQNYSITEKHLKSYCYSANYVYTILVDGYKFNTESWDHISFERQVKNTSIAWTLGYMLTLSNMIPAEAKLVRLPIDNTLFAGLLFLFSALIIITLVFLIIFLIRMCY
ncbi:ectonucleoside triphosphate diphosphohydrolase 3 [Clupea harengus]|uniref:Ectonucleoside triphosphate diphosphohydrolase 3 n=1 Tax=Clupea harengus TaxID=7950 RepID=A0A6P3VXW6_CLUHA|nr:ectonucleoside triphosphate diphosphohydrolase 3 [Clupea harengus]